MATLTLSTTGYGLRPYGGGDTPECHTADDIRYSRYCGATEYSGPGADRNVAVVRLTDEQAQDVIDDLQAQLRG